MIEYKIEVDVGRGWESYCSTNNEKIAAGSLQFWLTRGFDFVPSDDYKNYSFRMTVTKQLK